ncbi:glutathione S-transferase N-terminal domain-containing protein [Candidatus Woesearchaeota archaeon]|nr:glutathione S-transferase N-terminal domain-containing protein [Candidatus Woesearchaeota archaeon]
MTTIMLYQFEECPFCAKVRAVLRELKLPFIAIDVPHERDDPIRQQLLEKSGVPTVPVISIDGRYIGDSQKIIHYLEEHFKKRDTSEKEE